MPRAWIGCVVGAQLGVRQRFSAVRLVCSSPSPHTASNWLNQFGGKLNKKQDPSKIDNIVFYICPQERQMLSLSTTSTFEYPYLDTMRENTKGIYFGGQGRCIILAAKADCDRLFRPLMLWSV